MDIKLHKLARTTPATRQYIQTASQSAAALARELGVAVTTIYKWKHAGRVHDGSHVRHQLHASTTPEQEALIAELRAQLRLSLDDVTEVMNRCSTPRLSRSAIHRCLRRLGLARLPAAPQEPPLVGRFAATPCGYIHLDLKVLTKLQKRPSYVLVAIDRATRYVWVKVLPRRTAATVTQAVEAFLAAFPHPVHTILTDNDGAFTDRFAVQKKTKPADQPSGTHQLDQLCRAHGIKHRLIRPYHPQTNGMVERFNRRLSEALQSQPPLRPHCQNRFRRQAERNAFITRFVDNYNRTRLKCLNYQTPLQLLQNHTGQYNKGGEGKGKNCQRITEPHTRSIMPNPLIAPYGSWNSPLTSDRIVSESIRLGQIALDGDRVFWTESRPKEGGRNTIVRRDAEGALHDLTPAPLNVRTRVHEYGGGAYCVADGVVYFSNFSDQRLYRQHPDGVPEPITADARMYYADGIPDIQRRRLLCIREDHTLADQEPQNSIVSISLDNNSGHTCGTILVSGNDFYASPRLSPDEQQLAWLTWNHPNMPWDGTELWVADLGQDGSVRRARCVAGGTGVSIFQPEWSPDGRLHFVSDQSGWWNLYRLDDEHVTALYPMEAEFGEPQWVFGQRLYGFASPDRVICAYTQNGFWHLDHLDTKQRTLERFDLPYTTFDDVHVQQSRILCTASSPTEPTALIEIDADSQAITVLRRSVDFSPDLRYLSIPSAVTYPTEDGSTGHAFYYPPHNADYQAPPSERPPLLVKSHGGPTGASSPTFNLMIQFWTSRGFAVLDVNYGGSTGYGRAYRERLNGQWGIVDVDDCVSAVAALINRDVVDPARVTITGGSAGGFTTLCALTFRDCFTAGSSYYGVSDLEALVRDTHKFESRYLDRLVGPLPERKDLYDQRSPIHFTDRLSAPLILFQGLEDKVVPPNQAENMFNAVKAKGLPVAYIAFESEQHGFRQAKHIKQVLDNELYFYSKIFDFVPADPVEAFFIANLEE